jgi:hypothetical protein
MSFCFLDGYLVNAAHPLAKDASDCHVPRLPLIGCNRIRCGACGASIRSQAGLGYRESNQKVDVQRIYELADLATSPDLVAEPGHRLYLCRCRRWVEHSTRALNDPDAEDSFQAPRLPWKCDGHPVVELPHEFDGVLVTQDNLAELVTRSLHGTTPPASYPEDSREAFWAVRMHVRLAETPWQEVVVRAASAGLEDAEPKVRGRALQFFVSLELPLGMARALELLEGDRRLYAGIPDEITSVRIDKTLEDSLWRVASPLVRTPGRARDLARAEAVVPGKGRRILFDALASGDPEWVAGHVEEMVRANPTLAKALGDYIRLRFPSAAMSGPALEKLRAVQAASGSGQT